MNIQSFRGYNPQMKAQSKQRQSTQNMQNASDSVSFKGVTIGERMIPNLTKCIKNSSLSAEQANEVIVRCANTIKKLIETVKDPHTEVNFNFLRIGRHSNNDYKYVFTFDSHGKYDLPNIVLPNLIRDDFSQCRKDFLEDSISRLEKVPDSIEKQETSFINSQNRIAEAERAEAEAAKIRAEKIDKSII